LKLRHAGPVKIVKVAQHDVKKARFLGC